jgi:hypothetical protein
LLQVQFAFSSACWSQSLLQIPCASLQSEEDKLPHARKAEHQQEDEIRRQEEQAPAEMHHASMAARQPQKQYTYPHWYSQYPVPATNAFFPLLLCPPIYTLLHVQIVRLSLCLLSAFSVPSQAATGTFRFMQLYVLLCALLLSPSGAGCCICESDKGGGFVRTFDILCLLRTLLIVNLVNDRQ